MNHCNRNLSDSLRNRFSAVSRKKVRSDFAENFSEQREKIGKLGEIRFFSPPLQKQNCIVRNFFWSKMFLFHFFWQKKVQKKKKKNFGPKCLVSDDFDLFSVTGDRFRSSEPFQTFEWKAKSRQERNSCFLATGALQKTNFGPKISFFDSQSESLLVY